MKAIEITRQAPGGKRTELAKVLPLRTPLVVQIFPIYACNFACRYCVFSVEKGRRGFISDKIVMDFDMYKKCIDEMARFPDRIKVLRFVGMGEPLLHNKIAEMLAYAAQKDIAERLEILTNGSLLTPKMSRRLISSGLSRLVVSLQGTSSRKYKEICGADMDMDTFVSQLRFFYEHKGQAQMHVKIIDCALEDEEDRKRFFALFGNICDSIGVEYAGPIFPGVDYENVLRDRDWRYTQFGLPTSQVKICPQPFFTLQINPDGKIVPCYSIAYPAIMGDCSQKSVNEIWNGLTYRQFRRTMLEGIEESGEVCGQCNIIKHRLFPEDVLNQDAERLKRFYET